jgi:hypothetical protein
MSYPPSPLAEHLPTLLWDVHPSTINPQAMYRTIIERVIERGSKDDWICMLAYYGRDVVQQVIKTEPYMSDAAIAVVCQLFNLQKENLLCYQRKQLMPEVLFNY